MTIDLNETRIDLAKTEFPRQLDIATTSVYGLAILSTGLFLFLPLINLLHPSPWQRSMGTLHSFGALTTTIVVAYTGHLAFPLLRGSAKVLPQMRTLTFWATLVTGLALTTGNIAYARYRAASDYDGARAWLKANSPLVHHVGMEYHEFSTLFILPLGVACTWILWQHGDSILEKQHRPGLAVAKIHAL